MPKDGSAKRPQVARRHFCVACGTLPDLQCGVRNAQTQGGGNCANALTAAARLGLAPTLVTKLGSDAVGDGIVEELRVDGVDTSLVLRQPGASSPFTYIIVDAEGVLDFLATARFALSGSIPPPAEARSYIGQ